MSTDSNDLSPSSLPQSPVPLSRLGCYLVLAFATLGWFCAGFIMQTTSLAMTPVSISLLADSGSLDLERFQALNKQFSTANKPGTPQTQESSADRIQLKQWNDLVGQWFAWYQCAFLFGAAAGGLIFGRLGDRIGRAKAMGLAILTYSLGAAAAYGAATPSQLLVIWFLTSMGVGGVWPNGVALVAEAWSSLSRPMVASVIGTAGNVGILLMATIARSYGIKPDQWRWVMLIDASPVILGLLVLLLAPESPRWLATRGQRALAQTPRGPNWEIFRPPLLLATLLGITLAMVPVLGGWGSSNWMLPWATKVATADYPAAKLTADMALARSSAGIVGGLLAGFIISFAGRRRTYFVLSLAALAISQYIFWNLVPTDHGFLVWVAALGFCNGVYFSWLPLFLPELFPTAVRAAGTGVSFNFSRILTAVTVFTTGALIAYFGDYAHIGRITSLIFAVGVVVIWFAPDTSQKQLDD